MNSTPGFFSQIWDNKLEEGLKKKVKEVLLKEHKYNNKMEESIAKHINSLTDQNVQNIFLKFTNQDILDVAKKASRSVRFNHKFALDIDNMPCFFAFYIIFYPAIFASFDIFIDYFKYPSIFIGAILAPYFIHFVLYGVSKKYTEHQCCHVKEKVQNAINELNSDYQNFFEQSIEENPGGKLEEQNVASIENQNSSLKLN